MLNNWELHASRENPYNHRRPPLAKPKTFILFSSVKLRVDVVQGKAYPQKIILNGYPLNKRKLYQNKNKCPFFGSNTNQFL